MKRSEIRDTIFRTLANQRRRYVLHCLKHSENPMELRDLAEDIALLENERAVDEIPAEKVKDIHTALYHHHIPKLADTNMIRYQQEREMVALARGTKNLDEFEELLEVE